MSSSLLLLSFFLWNTYRSTNAGVHRLQGVVGSASPGQPVFDGKDTNFLLVGATDRTGMSRAEQRQLKVGSDASLATDTMMIVHIPADGSKATLISLPRDAYVAIPGYGMNKLNAAYVDGYVNARGSVDERTAAGANLLIRTVTNLTGLTVNHYVQVSMMGFYDISNAIGGVPINLCHPVDDTVAHNRAIGQDGGSGFRMSAGHHVIKGVTALEFVRQRHNLPNGDLDRVRRQQYFLTAAFRKVASVGILFKLHALGAAVTRNLYMDSGLNLIDLASQVQDLSANNIVGKTIPFEGFDNNSPVGSVELINPARVKRFVRHLVERPAKPARPTASLARGSAAADTHSNSAKSSRPKPLDGACIN